MAEHTEDDDHGQAHYVKIWAILLVLLLVSIAGPIVAPHIEFGFLKAWMITLMTAFGIDCWIYYLISGKVKVIKDDEEIRVLQRTGDIFGEMGVIDGSARSASVIAATKTVCLATDTSYIDRLSGDSKIAFGCILYKLFSEILANRLRLTTDELIKTREKLTMLKLVKKLELTSEELLIARNEIDRILGTRKDNTE